MGVAIKAEPVLLEPMLGIEVRVPQDLIGNVAGVITSKRGKIIDMQQKGILNIVIGEIPASETFDISEVMRGQTAGKAMWNTHFKAWTPAPKSIQAGEFGKGSQGSKSNSSTSSQRPSPSLSGAPKGHEPAKAN